MIYVVSGYRRSGTSAMMTALNAGGMPCLSNSKLDEHTAKQRRIDGYKPTKDLLYEVGRDFYMRPGVVRKFVSEHDDIALKVFYDGLPILPVHDYTVIFMQRDLEEIKLSIKAVDRYRDASIGSKVNKQESYPFNVYTDHRPADVKQCLDIAKSRSDMSVIEVWFRDLIENPIETLKAIKHTPLGRMRVPIDTAKAAEVIDPDWYRSRVA